MGLPGTNFIPYSRDTKHVTIARKNSALQNQNFLASDSNEEVWELSDESQKIIEDALDSIDLSLLKAQYYYHPAPIQDTLPIAITLRGIDLEKNISIDVEDSSALPIGLRTIYDFLGQGLYRKEKPLW